MKGQQPPVQASTCTILVLCTGQNVGYPMSAVILNPGPGSVYLGGKGVTSGTGFPLTANSSIEIDIVNEDLWAITTVTTTVYILRRGD